MPPERVLKQFSPAADRSSVNTIAATSQRIPRPALIGIVGLVAAFAVLMVVRSGLLGGSSSSSSSPAPVATHSSPSVKAHAFTKPAQPKVTLLPGLPASVAHALRYSKVAVVSLYVGQAPTDRAMVAVARKGARAAGAGFVAVNVGDDRNAATVTRFAGTVSTPATLVVKRPGTVVSTFGGPVDSTVLQQAARNAGARR
jgi:hypothetical protein